MAYTIPRFENAEGMTTRPLTQSEFVGLLVVVCCLSSLSTLLILERLG